MACRVRSFDLLRSSCAANRNHSSCLIYAGLAKKRTTNLRTTCFSLPPLYTTGLRPAVPPHLSCSPARVQIRGSVTRCRVGRLAACAGQHQLLGHGDLTNVDCRHSALRQVGDVSERPPRKADIHQCELLPV